MRYDIYKQGKGGIKVIVIGCVHGDELVGQKIIRKLRRLRIVNGTLITIIANTKALKAKKRFIDQDFNRAFPGSLKGNYEERLAHGMLTYLKKADFVLDIHSTTTDTTSAIILTKINRKIKNLLKLFNPKRVILMEKKVAKTALTGYCEAGISFEYGKDKSRTTYKETLGDIIKILSELKLLSTKNSGLTEGKSAIPHKTEYFQVLGTLSHTPGFKLNRDIKNFSLVRRGEVVAQKRSSVQKAPRDFYPLLFGPKSYKEIWGFMAKRVKNI